MSELADVLFGVFPFVDPLPRVPGKSREKIESSPVPAIMRLLEFLQRPVDVIKRNPDLKYLNWKAARLIGYPPRHGQQFELAPAADAFEAAHLRRPPPSNRRLARVTPARAGDPLRGACIGRRHQARARRRRVDRAGGDRRRWRAGPEWRDIRGVADPAGIRERPWIGWTERHAGYRRIAGAGRAGRRRQLCKCPGGDDEGERHEEDKRRISGHRGQSLQEAPLQRSCGARVPSRPDRRRSSRSAFHVTRFPCRPPAME